VIPTPEYGHAPIGYVTADPLKDPAAVVYNVGQHVNSGLIPGYVPGYVITSFINVTNDLFDLPEDTVNHPDRPLPAGKVREDQAWVLATVLLFFALYVSYKHSPWVLSVGSLAMFLGLLYNYYLKALPLIGNLTVSFVVFLAFLYGSGGYALHRVVPAGLLGAYLHLLRELVKSLQDMEGDAPYRKTVAIVLGEVTTRRIVFWGMILLPILAVIPVFFGYSYLYAMAVLLLVGCVVREVRLRIGDA